MSDIIDAVVIGGGPAGSAIGRLLAVWGHSVRIINKPVDRSRGLGESLPPSTKKLLGAIEVLDLVERAGFHKTTGNTVWWASRERRVETFDPSGHVFGYQVFRPDFDRVLLESAASAGAGLCEATVRRVDVTQPLRADVEYDRGGQREAISSRFVIDASGRAGVVAKPYRRFEPSHRMYALVGVWSMTTPARELSDDSHTVVETYQDGWAWSVPISATTRHVGTMVDGTSPRVTSGRALADAYRAEIDKTTQIARLLDEAALTHVFACDASLYSSETYARPPFVLAGDAGSFIDPLSSFGVKKALASAWVGAVVIHTCLTHPDRETMALDFFTQWERDVYATHLRRSRDFARAAHAQHPHAFWARRAETEAPAPEAIDERALMREASVRRAFEQLKQSADAELAPAEHAAFVQQPVIRGREIVVEDAIPLAALTTSVRAAKAAGVRFLNNIDLVALAELSRQYSRVPDLTEAYCRIHGAVPVPNVLGGLSLLVATGILEQRA